MNYFEEAIKMGNITEKDREKIRESISDENNLLEVSRAIECYFCCSKVSSLAEN